MAITVEEILGKSANFSNNLVATAVNTANAERQTTQGHANKKLVVWGLTIVNRSGGAATIVLVDSVSGTELLTIELGDAGVWPSRGPNGPDAPDVILHECGGASGKALYAYSAQAAGGDGIDISGKEAWVD